MDVPNASLHPVKQATTEEQLLFVVWIDDHCGNGPANWEWNSAPQPLESALEEARKCRASRFPTQVWPEGQSPREDGRNYPDEPYDLDEPD